MKFIIAALTSLFLLAPAMAQDVQEVQTGRGLICDTVEQIQQTIKTANEGKQELADGCTVMPVAFIENAKAGEISYKNKEYDIVEITVVGVITPQGIQPVSPASQFTIFPTKRVQASQ